MSVEFTDLKVADLSLAEFGRKEITLAEHEMNRPGSGGGSIPCKD